MCFSGLVLRVVKKEADWVLQRAIAETQTFTTTVVLSLLLYPPSILLEQIKRFE
jgi:hypothetical protein